MNLLDAVILGVLVLAAWRGVRVGAVAQLLSLCGTFVGLVAGVALVLSVDPHVANSTEKTVVAVGLLVFPALLIGRLTRPAVRRAGLMMRRARLGVLDAIGGAAIAITGALVGCWLLASILVNSSVLQVSQAVSQSAILRQVDQVMPPVPSAFAAVEAYLTKSGFPNVLINILPESPAPVQLPKLGVLEGALKMAAPATVKVVAFGCGGEEEGSGFVTTGGLVVTNAHVVAGSGSIEVLAPGRRPLVGTPVFFDPNLDLALLRVGSAGLLELDLSSLYATRGNDALVLGYPGGGPLTPRPAGILQRFDAEGRDIYDSGLTTRVVYELDAVVRPGNSGGPLVSPAGQVIGVVFSRSATNPTIGYALASPAIETDVERTTSDRSRVGTGRCVG